MRTSMPKKYLVGQELRDPTAGHGVIGETWSLEVAAIPTRECTNKPLQMGNLRLDSRTYGNDRCIHMAHAE